MIDDNTPQTTIEQVSPLMQAVLVLVLVPTGMALILQGFGWQGLDFLHPNPATPPYVFVGAGVFILCAALIVAFKALGAPRWVSDVAGWGTMAAAFMLMNWMVFYSDTHAACFIGPVPSLVLGVYGSMACDGIARAVVVLCDVVVVLIIWTEVLKRLRRRLPL